jgi:hypothetical protein
MTDDALSDDAPNVVSTTSQRDRRVGRAMQIIAIAGVLIAIIGSVVGWQTLGAIDDGIDSSLTIAAETVDTLLDTIDVADTVLASVQSGLTTLSTTLTTLSSAMTSTSGVASSVSTLVTTLDGAFTGIDAALAQVENLGATIDSVLTALSRLPLAPTYDPEVTFEQAIANVRATLAPVAQSIDTMATSLGDLSGTLTTLSGNLTSLVTDVDATAAGLASADQLLDQYRQSALDAQELVQSSQSGLGTILWWARAVTVLAGLLVAAAQLVPWWLGGRLRREPAFT